MNKPTDDLDAVRIVVEALQGFDPKDQQRIFRWAGEKLGMTVEESGGIGVATPAQSTAPTGGMPSSAGGLAPGSAQDIKSFVAAKDPRNDVQFAATVAYYYQFEAQPASRKTSIKAPDLQDACRQAGRKRLKHPGQTLRNAHMLGLLDKGDDAGVFSINSVGENLVAMTLPSTSSRTPRKTGQRPKTNSRKSSSSRKRDKKQTRT